MASTTASGNRARTAAIPVGAGRSAVSGKPPSPEEDTRGSDDRGDDASGSDEYGGPDPEDDAKGDGADEDQGT
jgi:hypothetical protein